MREAILFLLLVQTHRASFFEGVGGLKGLKARSRSSETWTGIPESTRRTTG
jgi:hypothetical protein